MKAYLSWITVLACSIAVSACAGGKHKNDQPQFGDSKVSQGDTKVRTEEKVETIRVKESKIPTLKSSSQKADLNRLEKDQFLTLGVPEELAQSIVGYRKDHGGKFNSVDELKQVPGMTDDLYNKYKDQFGVAPAA